MSIKGKRIFIVEDNAYNLSITTAFLELGEAVVQYERWNFDSLDRLIAFAPDLILLDMNLGKKTSGEDVFEKIKQTPELANSKVVAVTASDTATMIRLREKGFDGFIGKPIFPNFASHVNDVLNGKSVWIPSSNM